MRGKGDILPYSKKDYKAAFKRLFFCAKIFLRVLNLWYCGKLHMAYDRKMRPDETWVRHNETCVRHSNVVKWYRDKVHGSS